VNATSQQFTDLQALKDRLAEDFGKFPVLIAYPMGEYGDAGITWYHDSQHVATWVADKEQGWIFKQEKQS
jgi:hypothetical protein